MTKHRHYYKDVSKLDTIDVYRVLSLYEVHNPCVQHAVKKLLCAGARGAKDHEKDLREAMDSIARALQMLAEDSAEKEVAPKPNPKDRAQHLLHKWAASTCDIIYHVHKGTAREVVVTPARSFDDPVTRMVNVQCCTTGELFNVYKEDLYLWDELPADITIVKPHASK